VKATSNRLSKIDIGKETLSLSWDLHQAIHRKLSKLPNIAIHHIKAHQDRLTPNAELSPEAKLNIEADKLAEEAYSSLTFSDLVPMIPGVSAQLLIDRKTIVSKHRVIACDIWRTQAIKLRIQEQTGMKSIGTATHMALQTFLTIFRHGNNPFLIN
jgi:hypothetical protein